MPTTDHARSTADMLAELAAEADQWADTLDAGIGHGWATVEEAIAARTTAALMHAAVDHARIDADWSESNTLARILHPSTRDGGHAAQLVTSWATQPGRPIGRLVFANRCSCGWIGDWQPTAGLAHTAHDDHTESAAA